MYKYALLLSILLLVFSGPSFAQEENSGIVIESPYSFATASTAKNGAVFMIIKNYQDVPDRLIDASSDVAEINELHEMYSDPDTHHMMMRKVRDGIPIPAREGVALAPSGFHVMLIKLREPLFEGQSFPLTLTFEKAGSFTVETQVVAPGQKAETHDKRAVMQDHEKGLAKEGYKHY